MPKVQHAFTLMEMLVVISIITLLISITLPSLSSAKVRARETVCGSNMRQATIAFTSYTGDNSQYYPDFSYNPVTKAQDTSPPYWTPGYWRKHMLSYGLIREIIYSPSNALWNRDDFYWYGTGSETGNPEMVMGYVYFGGSLVNTSSFRSTLKFPPPAGVTNVFPRRYGTRSHSELIWTDLNRRQTYHLDTWLSPDDSRRWGSNHWYGKADQSVSGSHRAYTDNHVEWITNEELKLQSTYSVYMYW